MEDNLEFDFDDLEVPEVEIDYQPINDEDDCPDGACKI